MVLESYDVLVVGAGFAGRAAARRAAGKGASVLVIDPKPYFEFTPSALRCIVHPPAQHNASFRTSQSPGIIFRQGTVSALSASSSSATVKLASTSGSSMPSTSEISVRYRACIWAGGSDYMSPIKPSSESSASLSDRMAEFEKSLSMIRAASAVLVVGGGLVGVELAGELATRLPHTVDITLAASQLALLPRLPPRAGRLAADFMLRKNIRRVVGRVRPGDRDREYVCDGGSGTDPVVLTADVVFHCVGTSPSSNGDALRKLVEGSPSGDGGKLTRVRDTLQLYNAENVFVAGDAGVVDNELALWENGGLDGEKTAYAATEAGRLAADNAVRLLRGNFVGRMLHYPQDAFSGSAYPRMFAVSLGKWDGVLCLGPVVIGGVLAALTKVAIERFSVAALHRGGLADSAWTAIENVTYRLTNLVTTISRLRPRNPRRAHTALRGRTT
jgi:apoptosis-inducing factor 2